METNKVCKKCNTSKPTLEFGKKRSASDGLQVWCKPCMYANSREWLKNNPDKKKKSEQKSNDKLKSRYAEDNEYRASTKLRVKRFRQSLSTEERQRRDRIHWLKTSYGITVEQYNSLCAAQDGKCAICQKVPIILAVDHDHLTGEIRGLLCKSCNRAIGCLGDTPEGVMRAVKYLRRE